MGSVIKVHLSKLLSSVLESVQMKSFSVRQTHAQRVLADPTCRGTHGKMCGHSSIYSKGERERGEGMMGVGGQLSLLISKAGNGASKNP